MINKNLMKFQSYLYLIIGFIFLLFTNGPLLLPIAVFIAPIFLIRFMRFHKPWLGFLLLLPVGWISNIVVWKNMMPINGIFFFIITFQLSLFVALVYLADRIYTKKFDGFISTFVFPSAFVLLEFILVYAIPAGTIGKLAHTQSSLVLMQLLSLTGIWGITFIITWTASVINWLWDNHFEIPFNKKAALYYGIPVFLILLFGQIRLQLDKQNTETVKIASIIYDRNDAKSIKSLNDIADFEILSAQMGERFINNCDIAIQSGAKIIFGQEQLLHFWYEDLTGFIDTIKHFTINNDVYIGLSLSVITQDVREKNLPAENKIIWISPKGEILIDYYKAKPVYGPRIYGDGKLHYFDTPYGRMSTAICFDMDFLQVVNQIKDKRVDIMLVSANDFKEVTPYHTFLTSARAIEQGFNLVRPTGHGLSAAFDNKGQIISKLNFFENTETIMYSDVPTKGIKTVYAVLGDYFAYLCMLFFLTISFIIIFKRKIISNK
jgi:apolipoprotein N-acyltransferase